MATLAERIITLVRQTPGLTDREITDQLNGHSANQQPVNQNCRTLQGRGILIRQHRRDGLIGNYLAENASTLRIHRPAASKPNNIEGHLSEDDVKRHLEKWLTEQGWQVQVAWGHTPGADILAKRDAQRWIIEAKGQGSLNAMRVNYFLGVIGELLQRMNDPEVSYSIALPDLQQFRNLWSRLPDLAKQRTKISILFVDEQGNVVHDK
jgi:hypothetical protein